MKYPLWGAVAFSVILVLSALFPLPVLSKKEPEVIKETVYVPQGLSSAQILWLAKLMKCESGINTQAVNPIDLDGTSSLGLLQFKTATYAHFTGLYDIEGEIMDGTSQIDIVTRWLLNPGTVTWENQFPACVRLLGLPPSV